MTTSWTSNISKDALKRLIHNDRSEELHLLRLLKDKGYSTILDGIEIDGASWGQRNIINFSGLSLRSCNLINIQADKMLFTKTDLQGAVIASSSKLINADFTQADLSDTHIQRPIEGSAIFKNAIMDNAIIISGRDLIAHLTPKQYKQIIHIKIEPELYFNQDDIIKQYSNLSQLGVCNGLSIDFAKHIKLNRKFRYIDRLKSMTSDHCQEFAQSIHNYQENLQTFDTHAANESTIKIKGINFLEALPTELIDSNIIGITVKSPVGAHIITIAKIGDGYIIFDPNIGEIDCTQQSILKNKKELNQQVHNLRALYHKKAMTFGNIRVSDIEAIIEEIGTSNTYGKKIKKHNMSNFYISVFMLFCIVFYMSLDFTDDYTNSLVAIILSVITSSIISIYLAGIAGGFYKKHLSKTSYEAL